MSHSAAPNDGQPVKYCPCESWCYYGRVWDFDEHQEYCLRPVGPAVMARTDSDVTYEVTASQAHLRLPVTTSAELESHANRYHREVVQLVAIPHDDETETLVLNVRPGAARSLAAILVRAADLVEGLAR